MSRTVATSDIGRRVPLKHRRLPEQFFAGPAVAGEHRCHGISPPASMPRGIGDKLWWGTMRGVVSREREWHLLAPPGNRIILRIRATLEGDLLGVYHPQLTQRGHLRGLPESMGELRKHADFISAVCTGERPLDGFTLEPPIVPRLLHHLCAGTPTSYNYLRDPIVRERKTTTPSLPAVFWASMVTLGYLVWYFVDPGALADITEAPPGLEMVRNRLTLEDLLAAHRDQDLVTRWRNASQEERECHRTRVLQQALRILHDPPPWKWWAGTLRRTAGWVERNKYTGGLSPIAVTRWNVNKRSGLRTAAWRFGAPPSVQPPLFDNLTLEGMQ